jgi:arylsulfatase A-like enzyme
MLSFDKKTISERVYCGMISGVVAWTVYAIVECLFSSILPWFIKPNHLYVPVHWGFTGLLFLFYPLAGLILGGMAGFALHLYSTRATVMRNLQPTTFLPAFATLTIVLGYSINFILNLPQPFGLSEFPPVSVSTMLVLGSALSVISKAWFNRLRCFVNPWTASFLLLGLPWINEELVGNSSPTLKVIAALAYAYVVSTIPFLSKSFTHIWTQNRQIDLTPVASAKSLLTFLPVVCALFAFSFFLKQEPLGQIKESRSSPLAANRPNLILIVMDTVRADHLSVYGYDRDTTPNLRALSKQATLYTHAIAPSDITLSTHASIFTGLYARGHGAHYGLNSPLGRPLAENFETLAEFLSKNGYLTLAVVANHGVLGYGFNLLQGFNYHDPRLPIIFLGLTQPYFIRQGLRNILASFVSPSHSEMVSRRAQDINKEVLKLLPQAQKDRKPFFLFINYMDAHWPYIPPAPFDRFYPGKDEEFNTAYYYSLTEAVNRLERKLTPGEYSHLLSQYDGAIAYIDFCIANLLARMKKLNLYENSLVIITSDHGEAFGEKDLMSHGVSVYQNQIHVPLIIKFPKIKQAKTINSTVSLIDLFPTMLHVSGNDMPGRVDGRSLLNLEADKKIQRNLISESFPSGSLIDIPRFHRVERAIFSGSLKFASSTTGKRELYNLSDDPREELDLFAVGDEISEKLEAEMNKWVASVEPVSKEVAPTSKLDTDTINRLKSLGYVK